MASMVIVHTSSCFDQTNKSHQLKEPHLGYRDFSVLNSSSLASEFQVVLLICWGMVLLPTHVEDHPLPCSSRQRFAQHFQMVRRQDPNQSLWDLVPEVFFLEANDSEKIKFNKVTQLKKQPCRCIKSSKKFAKSHVTRFQTCRASTILPSVRPSKTRTSFPGPAQRVKRHLAGSAEEISGRWNGMGVWKVEVVEVEVEVVVVVGAAAAVSILWQTWGGH